MSGRLPSFSTLTWVTITVLPAFAVLMVVMLVLRAQPMSSTATYTSRGGPRSTLRPLMEGQPRTVNQLGTYAGNGAAGPSMDFSVWGGLILLSVNMEDTKASEVLEYLRRESERLNPHGRGIDFVFSEAQGDITAALEKRISMRLTNIPLSVALQYVTDLAGLDFRPEGGIVTIEAPFPGCILESRLVTREFKVSADFITWRPPVTGSDMARAEGFLNGGLAPGGCYTTKDILTAAGVSFDEPGPSATYLASSSQLVVRHTQQNIDLIESLVAQMTEKHKGVDVTP